MSVRPWAPGTAARAGWRHLWRHPWQVGLTVLGVALGVAVVVAVNIANSSATRAFHLSVQDVAGPSTDQIVGGPDGLDERLYTRLRVEAGIRPSAPVVSGYGRARGRTLQLLGVDPFAEADFHHYLDGGRKGPDLRRLLVEPDTVLMAPGTARRLDLSVGDRFRFQIQGRTHTLTLIGLLAAGRAPAAALDGLMVADMATAQALLQQVGRLDRIDLILPKGAAGGALRSRIRGMLPADARLQPAGARASDLLQMSRAFRTNLTAMSLLGLVVGMFLIYNTMTFAVLQRRPLLASLRLLGVTRGGVFALVITEALAVGLAGTALGLALGVALGDALVHLVTRTINDLYFALTVDRLMLTPLPFIEGIALGLGATVLAALIPALEAARTPPQGALSRSLLEHRARRLAPVLAGSGAVMAAAAVAVLVLSGRSLNLGFVGLFLLVLGLTLMTPLTVAALVRAVGTLAGPVLGVQGRLAVRGVSASLSRTGVAVAALMLAVSTTVGVGIMVASFRSTVQLWLGQRLQADIYVAAAGVPGAGPPPPLAPAVVAQVRAVPGIAQVTASREVSLRTAHGPARIMAVDLARHRPPRFALKAGNPDRVWPAFRQGRAVLVSEPYAYRHQVGVGDHVTLPTPGGPRHFPIAGVFYDYQSGPGVVLMSRDRYARDWHDKRVNSVGLYLAPGQALEPALAAVRRAIHSDQQVRVRANRAIRAASLAVFDRTFTITNVLRLLAVVVAFVGILSALMALQLERARELAILRATGVTPGQIRALVAGQTGFMGLAAGLLALPVGLVLALMLIEVINRRAFGWSMQTLVPWPVLAEALALALGAALAAGWYPGRRMARVSPAEALREE